MTSTVLKCMVSVSVIQRKEKCYVVIEFIFLKTIKDSTPLHLKSLQYCPMSDSMTQLQLTMVERSHERRQWNNLDYSGCHKRIFEQYRRYIQNQTERSS